MLTWYNFSSDHWGFSRLRSFANLQGENHKQCCQNSFQRTNSVLLRKPPFQKFTARFIKRMPKYPFFWEMCVFFPQFGEICQKIWKISQFFHQKLNILSKQKNLNFIKCILFWFSFHESFFRKFDSKRFPFLKKFIIFQIFENIYVQKCNKKCKGGQKKRISDAKIRFFSVFLGFFARFFHDILAKSSGFFGKKFWQHWS